MWGMENRLMGFPQQPPTGRCTFSTNRTPRIGLAKARNAGGVTPRPPAPFPSYDCLSAESVIERLADAVAQRIKPTFPLTIELWDLATVAQYFRRDPRAVRQTLACLPSFPKAIRLPTGRVAHPLYKAAEIIQWAKKHQERN